MMSGLRLPGGLVLATVSGLFAVFVGHVNAEEPVTTRYKSTTIERVTTTREETRVETPVRTAKPVCAVFVRNRATNVPDDKIGVLQDFASAHVTETGFKVISRESAMKAVADAGANARPAGDVDAVLSNNASALQLARNLGADAILNLSISSYGVDRTSYSGHNLNVTSYIYRLKVSFELLDILRGGTHTGGVVTVSFTDRKQDAVESVRENVVDDLLDGAAADVANMLTSAMRNGTMAGVIDAAAQVHKQASFALVTTVADFPVPQVVRDDGGQYVVGHGTQLIEVPLDNVELDGNLVSSTNGMLQASAGLHKLRLGHKLFKDWQGTVFVSNGGRLVLSLQLNEAGRTQLNDVMGFYAGLKPGQILTDAQLQEILGKVKVLEQSGLKVSASALPSH